MVERFIFDLDGTLLNADFELESKLLGELFPNREDELKFVPYKVSIIEEYESKFLRYDKETFSRFISSKTGLNVGKEFIEEWLRFSSCLNDQIIDGVGDTLEYLKSKDRKIIILSNWFTEVQIERLKKNGLFDYFDEIYGGDYTIKPNREAFLRAFGNTSPSNCIMIGDNYLKDVCGARKYGAEALFFGPKDDLIEDKQKIKRVGEIKERY